MSVFNDFLVCKRFPEPLQETLPPLYNFYTKIRTKRRHFLILEVNEKINLLGVGIYGVPVYQPVSVEHILFGDDICNPDNQKIALESIKEDVEFNKNPTDVHKIFYDNPVILKPGKKYLLYLNVQYYSTIRKINAVREICVEGVKFKFTTVHDIRSQTTADHGNFPEFYFEKF